jgi:hypothetical protein
MSSDIVVLQSQEFGHVPKQIFVTEFHPRRNLQQWKPERSDPAFYRKIGEVNWKDEIALAIKQRVDDVCHSPPEPAVIVQVPSKNPRPETYPLKPVSRIVSINQETGLSESPYLASKKPGAFFYSYGDLAVVTSDGYFVAGKTSKSVFRLTTSPLNCIIQSPTGGARSPEFFSASNDGDILLVSSSEGKLKQKRLHERSVYAIASIGNHKCISAGADQSILLWSSETMEVENQFDFHDSTIQVLHACIGNEKFVSGDSSGIIAFWNSAKPTSPFLWSASTGNKTPIRHVSSSNKIISVVDDKGGLFLWDVNGTILWKHVAGVAAGGKICASFFPGDPSILFLVIEIPANDSLHIQTATISLKEGILGFQIDDLISPLPISVSQIANRPNPDNSISLLNKDFSVTVVKRK